MGNWEVTDEFGTIIYRKNNWYIEWYKESKVGKINRILKVGNSKTTYFSKEEELKKGLGIPNYVVDKANEIIRNN